MVEKHKRKNNEEILNFMLYVICINYLTHDFPNWKNFYKRRWNKAGLKK
jgi:hypothetical protein